MICVGILRAGRGACFALVACILALSSSLPVAAEEASGVPALTIRMEGNAVTMRAESMPLREVLAQLANAGDFKVRNLERLPARNVSVDFESVTMRQALDGLLGGVSHAMILVPGDPHGAVSVVFVLAPAAPADIAAPAPDGEPPPTPSAATLIEILEHRGDLPEDDRAALEAQLEFLSSGAAEIPYSSVSPDSLAAALEAVARIAEPAMSEEDRRRLVEEMERILDQVQ